MMTSFDRATRRRFEDRGAVSDVGESSGRSAATALAFSVPRREENQPPDDLATAGPYGGQNW
jgi:hypothetical protein